MVRNTISLFASVGVFHLKMRIKVMLAMHKSTSTENILNLLNSEINSLIYFS